MTGRFRVTAACLAHVPVHEPGGVRLTLLYRGAVLPEGVPSDRVKAWLADGLVEKIAAEPGPAAEGVAAKAGEEKKQAAPTKTPEPPEPPKGEEPERPPETGPGSSEKAWRAYAVARGMAEDEAAAKSRADLIAAYPAE